ncbi:MAG: sigma-70 family RNA polymerase sigma factor [Ktedonobacterales bacterium]|nr:sigma-70 family RNA polymerase sigma factor [Ktedonobacterales bacterium]
MMNEDVLQQEFVQFVDLHIMKAMRYAITLLARQFTTEATDEAEDAVQEALIATWRHWEKIQHRDSEKAVLQYLFTTLRRECFHRMKKSPPYGDVTLTEVDAIMASPLSFPGSSEHLDVMELRETILSLPTPYSRIIIGMDYENKTFQEMAEELGVTRRRMYDLREVALKMMERALTVGSPKDTKLGKGRTKGVDDMRP